MIRKWVFMLVVLLPACPAWAINYSWSNFSGTAGNWTDAANWVDAATLLPTGAYPVAGDRVYGKGDSADWATVDPIVMSADNPNRELSYDMNGDTEANMIQTAQSWYNWTPQIIIINAADSITISRWRGGNSGHLANIKVNISGSLTVLGSEFDVARSHYSAVEFVQNAGSAVTADFSNGLRIGSQSGYRSVYTMHGGTLTTQKLSLGSSSGYGTLGTLGQFITLDGDSAASGAKSEMNLLGGDVYVTTSAGLVINSLAPVKGVIKIAEGGVLHVLGTYISTSPGEGYLSPLESFIVNGNIVPVTAGQTILYHYDDQTGYTNIYVPEPAAMILLGLGSVLAIRRRK